MATDESTRRRVQIQEKLQETLQELSKTPYRKLVWLQLRERARALEWALGGTPGTNDPADSLSLQKLGEWWSKTRPPRSATIEIRDVRMDGFPKGEDEKGTCYFWARDCGLLAGWPLIAEPGEYEGDSFMTLEEAIEDPAEVEWEAGEGGGEFSDVRFWVPADALEKAFKT